MALAGPAGRNYTRSNDMLRRTRYQYYTNVNYLTCEDCLAWHGVIRRNPDDFPQPNDSCERAILPIPPKERKAYREKGKRMRAAARAELERRWRFEEGMGLLPERPEEALDAFRAAAGIDVYVPDIERLTAQHRDLLQRAPEFRQALRGLFAKAYSDKFGWRRYERLPEEMRLQREQAGIARIHELFR